MNIKKKDRKEHTKGKNRQTEIQILRQIYQKMRKNARETTFEEYDINTVMIM